MAGGRVHHAGRDEPHAQGRARGFSRALQRVSALAARVARGVRALLARLGVV